MIDNLSVGGAQTLLATFAQSVEPGAAELTVIVLRDAPHPALLTALESSGVTVAFHHAPRLADLRRGRQLMQYVRQQRFDVVVTHLFHANVLGALVRGLTKTPTVTVLHNVVAPAGAVRTPLWQNAVRRGSDVVVACGHTVRDVHANWLTGTPFVTLPNPVALPQAIGAAERHALRKSLVADADTPLIVSVGTISRQKAFQDLVAALTHIDLARQRLHLAIAGRGKPQAIAGLERTIDEHGLRDHVTLLGQRDDIPALLQSADLYVCSSHWEGLPISVLEAMAAGLPVIATEVGDNRRIVPQDAGVLVPPERPDLLGQAIGRMLADPDDAQRRGRNARAAVAEHHDPGVWVRRHLDLYASVIAGPSATPPEGPA